MFDGGLCQILAATSYSERSAWMDTIRVASYEGIRAELLALRQCLERRRSHKPNIDLQMWRLQKAHVLGKHHSGLNIFSVVVSILLLKKHNHKIQLEKHTSRNLIPLCLLLTFRRYSVINKTLIFEIVLFLISRALLAFLNYFCKLLLICLQKYVLLIFVCLQIYQNYRCVRYL